MLLELAIGDAYGAGFEYANRPTLSAGRKAKGANNYHPLNATK
jgi:hypothetical protein